MSSAPVPSSPDAAPLSPTPSDASRPTTASDSATSAPTPPVPKRKPSRRANTAERRATHNAVERQRRETLNGRFLDLAALLPNLATVRRPSKSAIVNSSIALIHSQRRARAAAGRELRSLEAEADALRREVNEWRARSGAALPALLAPQRTPEFIALAAAEDAGAGAEEEERRAYALAGAGMDDDDDLDPTDDHHPPRGMPGPAVPDPDKLAQWNVHLQYALAQQQARQQEWAHHQAQAALFTPPSTAHGHDNTTTTTTASPADVFAGFRQFPTTPHFAYGLPAGFPTPEMDDTNHTESTNGSPPASAVAGPTNSTTNPTAATAAPANTASATTTSTTATSSTNSTTTALYSSGGYPRRPSLSVGHAHPHTLQQQQQQQQQHQQQQLPLPHAHPHTTNWAVAAAAAAQFPAVSLLI